MAAPFVKTDIIITETDLINGLSNVIAGALGNESIPTIAANSKDPGVKNVPGLKNWNYSVSGTADNITLNFSAESIEVYDIVLLADERWKLSDITITFKNLSSAFASGLESLNLKALDTTSDIEQPLGWGLSAESNDVVVEWSYNHDWRFDPTFGKTSYRTFSKNGQQSSKITFDADFIMGLAYDWCEYNAQVYDYEILNSSYYPGIFNIVDVLNQQIVDNIAYDLFTVGSPIALGVSGSLYGVGAILTNYILESDNTINEFIEEQVNNLLDDPTIVNELETYTLPMINSAWNRSDYPIGIGPTGAELLGSESLLSIQDQVTESEDIHRNWQSSPTNWSNGSAFAAIDSFGRVVAWGDPNSGGDISSVRDELNSGAPVTKIFSSFNTFLALKKDGSAVYWGDSGVDDVVDCFNRGMTSQISTSQFGYSALKNNGATISWGSDAYNFSDVADNLHNNVEQVFSNWNAFAALTTEGSVITWGQAPFGGDSSNVASELQSGVENVVGNWTSFAALKNNGQIITWGNPSTGGDSVFAESNYIDIFPSNSAYAALSDSGSVTTWGSQSDGGDSSAVSDLLSSGITDITAASQAFAAIRENGQVVTWGNSSKGGDVSKNSSGQDLLSTLSNGVTAIISSENAFTALKDNGYVYSWGKGANGTIDSLQDSQNGDFIKIVANANSFAGIKQDGSVRVWGDVLTGGSLGDNDFENFALQNKRYTDIFASEKAFTALANDGTIVSWGDPEFGGYNDNIIDDINGRIRSVSSPFGTDLGASSTALLESQKPGNYVTTPSPIPVAENPVNRLYNSSQRDYIFSSNQNEIDSLTGIGWDNEGTLYLAPVEATAEVFRFDIASENRHFYTALESERDIIIGDQTTFSGWDYEGGAFSAYSTNDFPDDAVAVVRYLNEVSGNHVYSTSAYEQSLLDQNSDWINEGIAWYGDPIVSTTNLI